MPIQEVPSSELTDGSAVKAQPDTKLALSRSSILAMLKHWIGLDRAIAFTILARGWQGMAGLITIALIARFLSPAEQGYYYTFGSLVAIQVIFELGFSFVILQMASHESAHLSIAKDGTITGDAITHARLASILQKAAHWYTVAALIMLAALVPSGIYFFTHHSHAGQDVAWRLPWYFVAIATACTFQIDPMFSFLEGCGYVPQVAKTRFWQAFFGACLAWVALFTHHGLFAPAIIIGCQALVGLCLLYTRRHLLLGLFRYSPGPHKIHWGNEVWPFQWRIAVSWICGYITFCLFNPILFAYKGPVVAGQMGMSLSISNALVTVAMAWISTKAAPFGSMIARKEYVKLDQIFFRSVSQATAIVILGSAVVWAGVEVLNSTHNHLAIRVLSPGVMAMLLLTMIANVIYFAEAIYLRAHKQEKFLSLSIIGATLSGLLTFFLGKYFGASGMVIGYLLVQVFVGLACGTYLFNHYRRIWHAA